MACCWRALAISRLDLSAPAAARPPIHLTARSAEALVSIWKRLARWRAVRPSTSNPTDGRIALAGPLLRLECRHEFLLGNNSIAIRIGVLEVCCDRGVCLGFLRCQLAVVVHVELVENSADIDRLSRGRGGCLCCGLGRCRRCARLLLRERGAGERGRGRERESQLRESQCHVSVSSVLRRRSVRRTRNQ